jgi:hypothetical protein
VVEVRLQIRGLGTPKYIRGVWPSALHQKKVTGVDVDPRVKDVHVGKASLNPASMWMDGHKTGQAPKGCGSSARGRYS